MQPHPDFAECALPRRARLGEGFYLSPLSPTEVDEDLAAVTKSERVLKGLFGDDWPAGLTRADNLVDMGWHEREFTSRRSFAWILRNEDGAYLGCAYLYPEIGSRGRGEVVTWACDTPNRVALLGRFNPLFLDWLKGFIPAGYHVTLTSNTQPD